MAVEIVELGEKPLCIRTDNQVARYFASLSESYVSLTQTLDSLPISSSSLGSLLYIAPDFHLEDAPQVVGSIVTASLIGDLRATTIFQTLHPTNLRPHRTSQASVSP